ncbi:MAG TPA: serine hydrolase domain-containing protein [Steroidobacteraceae bacterium]|nr:serine hydrolase domain-containing protein [Steroidobacteraceae bacterium]
MNDATRLFGLLVLSTLAWRAPAAEPADVPQVAASLDPLFTAFMAENHVPGLVFGVVHDGKLVYTRGLGIQDTATHTPVDADTVFRIASMSKQFSALATLKLRDAGKLELDAPAERYLPELARWKYPTADSPKIRVRDLLSHAAGFVTDDPWGDRQLPMSEDDFTTFAAAGVPFSRAPGTGYEYSNFGYALVGRLVTNVAKRNYADYITANFLKPLGMDASTYDIATIPKAHHAIGYRWENDAWREEPALGPGAFGAMGGLATSANDYAKYVAWVLSAWPPRDGAESPILRRASVREITRPANYTISFPPLDATGCARSSGYGFGVHSQNDCILGQHFLHSGGLPGYGSNVLFVPNRSLAVFAFANRTYAPASRVVRDAANLLVKSGAFPVRAAALSPALRAMLDAAVHIYASGDVMSEPAAFAMNFFLDRDATLRNADIAALREKTGACRAPDAPTADNAMSGTFELPCEHGTVKVNLILAPSGKPSLQKLDFTQ